MRELSLGERMRMELIAALLHGPDVLLLDEPTIGLDVVSQHRVQEFLRFYQAERKITVLLTSHYMKDVEALCKRAIIINHGKINHDGPLADIVDRFGRHKIMDLQFTGEVPDDLAALWPGRRGATAPRAARSATAADPGDPDGPVGELQHRGRRRAGTAARRRDRRNVRLGPAASDDLRRRPTPVRLKRTPRHANDARMGSMPAGFHRVARGSDSVASSGPGSNPTSDGRTDSPLAMLSH